MLLTWALFSGEQTAKRQCFQKCLHPSSPQKVDQAAKDLMSRALEGSCDLGAVVEVWFSLVLEYLSHGLPFIGSKVTPLEQALIRTVRIWQGRGEKQLNKCVFQWGFVRKSTLWSKNQTQSKVLWMILIKQKCVTLGEERIKRWRNGSKEERKQGHCILHLKKNKWTLCRFEWQFQESLRFRKWSATKMVSVEPPLCYKLHFSACPKRTEFCKSVVYRDGFHINVQQKRCWHSVRGFSDVGSLST